MAGSVDDRTGSGTSGERAGIDWRGVRQRLAFILVLLVLAVLLVVGTQNLDERATVHFLLWSFDAPLLLFFLASVALGILADEFVRLFMYFRRRSSPQPSDRPFR